MLRQYRAWPRARVGASTSADQRTIPSKIRTWSIVWFAPVWRSSAGRSAVRTISGRALNQASSTAGSRFATAVPEVVITGTGAPPPLASPSARKPALRSSMRTCSRISPRSCARAASMASGALREPGASTTSLTPERTNSSRITCAAAVDGFTQTTVPRECHTPVAGRGCRRFSHARPTPRSRLRPRQHFGGGLDPALPVVQILTGLNEVRGRVVHPSQLAGHRQQRVRGVASE